MKVRSAAVVLVENEDVTERSVRGQVKVSGSSTSSRSVRGQDEGQVSGSSTIENEDVTERSVRGQVKVRSVAVVLVAGQ